MVIKIKYFSDSFSVRNSEYFCYASPFRVYAPITLLVLHQYSGPSCTFYEVLSLIIFSPV